MIKEFFEEIWDELTDFIEDYWEIISRKHPRKDLETRTVDIRGVKTAVRPAYLFAERIDNLIKIGFGGSVLISAFTSTIFGFVSLSDLVDALIKTIPGRVFMLVIGSSYLVVALWKILHLGKKA